jgi:hypothetical protein
MKMNQNIDELLNSFVDGELTQSQQSEVQRLIADDPQVAQRLRQLRACKALVSSLPRAQAPAQTLQRIKASLQAETPLRYRPVSSAARKATRFVLVRRLVAAAAVIGLIVVLAAVVQTLVPHEVAPDGAGPAVNVAAGGFSGRLELKTTTFAAVDASIKKAIHNNGLSDCVTPTRVGDKNVYSLRCTKERLNLLLADLNKIWQEFDTATLFVDTEHFGNPIVIDAVTAKQTAEIVNQQSLNECIDVAKDFVLLHNMAESMPGKDILAAIGDEQPSSINIPKPDLTWNKETVEPSPTQVDDSQKVNLTIVLSSSE